MLAKIRSVGLYLSSVKGFAWFASTWPTIAVFIAGRFEGLGVAESITACTVTLAGGMCLVYYGLGVYEMTASYLTSKREQHRISEQIDDCIKAGVPEIDTSTAAAIWANTRNVDDIIRHLRFRQIKAAISRQEIRNTIQRGGTDAGPNIHTWIPVDELKDYFVRIGVAKAD